MRGTYLASGDGKLTKSGTHIVNVSGSTTCNKISDEVKVTLHLQRLVGNTWTNVYTLGPKNSEKCELCIKFKELYSNGWLLSGKR